MPSSFHLDGNVYQENGCHSSLIERRDPSWCRFVRIASVNVTRKKYTSDEKEEEEREELEEVEKEENEEEEEKEEEVEEE